MSPASQTTIPLDYPQGKVWLPRLVKSNSFAWTLSLGLHGMIFLGLYLVVFREDVQPRRQIIPEAQLVDAVETIPPESMAPLKLARQPLPVPAEQPKTQLDELPIAAITLNQFPAAALPTENDKSLTMSMESSQALGPVSSFFGLAGNAYKVVYVVDVSASLMIYIDEIIRELHQSINSLLPTQRFHIILAKPRKVVAFGPSRLVPAIGRHKSAAEQFINTISGIPKPGKADPIEAMKLAFAAKPELIYFLTDGDYPDIQADLEMTLKKLNPNQEVKITTIGFDPSPAPRALLERIARRHGGHFRAVEPK